MPHSNGYRARTRDMFAKSFRTNGVTKLSTYMINYKVGDYVDIFADPAQHKGMPHKFYHGRTGIIFNITKRAVGVRVNKLVNGTIIQKKIHVRLEHVKPSKCRSEILKRIKQNEAIKAQVRKEGSSVKLNLKRVNVQPKAAYTLKKAGGYKNVSEAGDGDIETIQPKIFVDLL
mmetsp:Transcript_25722/g.33701  ORF Transcript_25722/g.33701 Transcript_25722/m.33701 type:complete len:173 (+) Transcript_25722:96-614(+)